MERLSSDAALMRAALILGSADHCLTLACDYAATRRQFGKALCANQAIRHMLARAKLQIEGVRSIVYRAAREDGDTEFLKRAAAAGALHSCPILVETAIQVYGGMGFTWDVPLHLHLRRMRTLAAQDGLGESAARVADLYLPSVEAHGVEMATRGA
jgi:alkylation response protein AidB-like acyl-CoA dehydrogenase